MFNSATSCLGAYCTKQNAIYAGVGITALGIVGGGIACLVLYGFPECKTYTFKSMITDPVKFSGKPTLSEYDSLNFEAPATKEENYKEKFTINPDSWFENECDLNVKKEGLS